MEQQQPASIHCKVFCADQIRRLPLAAPFTYVNLQTSLRQLFPTFGPDQINIKYKDDEGDLVTISSDPELESAISISGPNAILRLHVFSSAPNPPIPLNPVQPVNVLQLPESREAWKSFKHEKKEQKRQIKMMKHKGRPGSEKSDWKAEKKMRKKMDKLAKKNPEKLVFIGKFNAVFEPAKSVAVSKQPNTPLVFNIIVQNSGTETWPVSTVLKHVGKCKVFSSAPDLTFPQALGPMASAPITLNFTSPEFGVHVSKWRLFLPDGKKFGPKLIIKIRSPNSDIDKRMKVRRGRGGCRGGRGRGMGREHNPRFAAQVQQLKELGYEGPHVWRLLRRFRGDINLVLDHLNNNNNEPAIVLDPTPAKASSGENPMQE